jgi:3-oxosteroid 1-dehydrogenase
MVVDRTGRRFACDRDFYQQRGAQMLGREDRKCVFFVFDERAWGKFEGPIKGLGSAYPSLEGDEDAIIRASNEVELAKAISAKLKEVCPGFELDSAFASSLTAQVQRFNAMALSGKDTEFGRGDKVAQYCWSVPRAKDNNLGNKTMFPLDRTKLCCVILGLSVLDTKGGPEINAQAQVLGANRQAVPGLYGAGNAIKSFTRLSYPASGVTISSAVLFGWKAGQHAAERARMEASSKM